MDEVNPYAASSLDERQPAGARDPVALVQAPAIALMVTSAIWSAMLLLATMARVRQHMMVLESGSFEDSMLYLITTSLTLLWPFVVLWGSFQMLRMRSYFWARAAAAMAIVPICGPCVILGVPLGIWALIVLRKPEVRAAFPSEEVPGE